MLRQMEQSSSSFRLQAMAGGAGAGAGAGGGPRGPNAEQPPGAALPPTLAPRASRRASAARPPGSRALAQGEAPPCAARTRPAFVSLLPPSQPAAGPARPHPLGELPPGAGPSWGRCRGGSGPPCPRAQRPPDSPAAPAPEAAAERRRQQPALNEPSPARWAVGPSRVPPPLPAQLPGQRETAGPRTVSPAPALPAAAGEFPPGGAGAKGAGIPGARGGLRRACPRIARSCQRCGSPRAAAAAAAAADPATQLLR
ncbi:translation initiation factor IF-2-like [Dermochelys coriacea]|uniref:translation initiation factor IF-2-like n=1 Tax=Dermochelys coriacea TaxID=27794 RepID=UPI0018E727CF|nr:translation initiation factor IF-2-like [Dermochelys coriacea]XP_043356014.1 translation initiation factor IF-2-like [Dermochelys coriacea]